VAGSGMRPLERYGCGKECVGLLQYVCPILFCMLLDIFTSKLRYTYAEKSAEAVAARDASEESLACHTAPL
jgi:hypothetical protein